MQQRPSLTRILYLAVLLISGYGISFLANDLLNPLILTPLHPEHLRTPIISAAAHIDEQSLAATSVQAFDELRDALFDAATLPIQLTASYPHLAPIPREIPHESKTTYPFLTSMAQIPSSARQPAPTGRIAPPKEPQKHSSGALPTPSHHIPTPSTRYNNAHPRAFSHTRLPTETPVHDNRGIHPGHGHRGLRYDTQPASPHPSSGGLKADLKNLDVKKEPPQKLEPTNKIAFQHGRKFKPILFSAEIGKGALHPPRGTEHPPKMNLLAQCVPLALPDGTRIDASPPSFTAIEALAAPDITILARFKSLGWHKDENIYYYTLDNHTIGQWAHGQWVWFEHRDNHIWAAAGPDATPLLRYQNHWWWNASGVWFLIEQGEPWAYRYFSQWQQEGLIHPQSGTQMVYSADGRRVAVVTPNDGAVIFDAQTGDEISNVRQEQMPRRHIPHAPSSLNPPQ